MQTKMNKISRAVTLAATLSLPLAAGADMSGMSGMGGMSGMSSMGGMMGMSGMGGMYGDAELTQRVKMSRMAIMDFMQTLKRELVTAMKAGGPVNAIGVCNEKAPQIATVKQQQLGWEIGRVSLRNRNPDNAPDAWETAVLESFENMKRQGGNAGKMEYFEVVDSGAGRQFRYMKAIPTGEVCTKCHGTAIAPEIAVKLNELYPEDKATGFKVGDLRGAFTIKQPLR